MVSLVGKVALVTGGAQGIGKAVCKSLLDEKVKVCFGDVNVERGEATLKEFQEEYGVGSVNFEKLDVADEDQFESVVKRVMEHFGGYLDILINNAGMADEINWKRMFQVNLFGTGNGIELAHHYLCNSKGEKGGTVINIASVAGIKPVNNIPHYSASKCGVIGLTLTWGHESNVKRTNVKVNAVCPDLVDTGLLLSSKGTIDSDNVKLRVEELTRNGMLLKPSQVAEGVIKVLNDDLTRAVLVVSGCKGMYYYPYSTDDILFESDKI